MVFDGAIPRIPSIACSESRGLVRDGAVLCREVMVLPLASPRRDRTIGRLWRRARDRVTVSATVENLEEQTMRPFVVLVAALLGSVSMAAAQAPKLAAPVTKASVSLPAGPKAYLRPELESDAVRTRAAVRKEMADEVKGKDGRSALCRRTAPGDIRSRRSGRFVRRVHRGRAGRLGGMARPRQGDRRGRAEHQGRRRPQEPSERLATLGRPISPTSAPRRGTRKRWR